MDFRQLQYVLRVAEERSFSKAAKSLYIAQPSLSQYISKVEQQLGIQLFDRATTPLGLTFAGERFVETAKHILDLNEGLLREIEDMNHLNKGRLIIGIPITRGTLILPIILPIFHKKFPGIEVVLLEGTSTELEELTIKGKTDLTIINLPFKLEHISYQPILTEEILIAIPPNHPLSTKTNLNNSNLRVRPKVSLHDLRDEPFILLKQGQRLRQFADDLFTHAGFKPRIVLESKSVEIANQLVAAGLGITFVPEMLAQFNGMLNPPIYGSLKEPVISWTLVAAYREGRYLTRAAQEFITVMKEVLGVKYGLGNVSI